MTKLRPPLSVHAAIARVVGQLARDYDEAAEITDCKPGTIRAYGDPDRREEIPVTHAIALDLAYMASGGEGAPIFEAYAHKLELAELAQFADRIALHKQVVRVIQEGGEAHAALVRACQADATSADRVAALRESAEAFEEMKRVIPLLDQPETKLAANTEDRARAPP